MMHQNRLILWSMVSPVGRRESTVSEAPKIETSINFVMHSRTRLSGLDASVVADEPGD
jgi:hypothetical protein